MGEIDNFQIFASSLINARTNALNIVIAGMDLFEVDKFIDDGGDIFDIVVVDVEQL